MPREPQAHCVVVCRSRASDRSTKDVFLPFPSAAWLEISPPSNSSVRTLPFRPRLSQCAGTLCVVPFSRTITMPAPKFSGICFECINMTSMPSAACALVRVFGLHASSGVVARTRSENTSQSQFTGSRTATRSNVCKQRLGRYSRTKLVFLTSQAFRRLQFATM